MKQSSLFVLGLALGAVIVFLVRAAALGDAPAPAAPSSPAPHDEAAHQHPAPAPAPAPAAAAEPVLVVRVTSDGEVARATLEMPDGTRHEVAPGGHAPMGDLPARIEGRDGAFRAHVHPHDDGHVEITVFDLADRQVAHAMRTVRVDAAPENEICPVMGNEVDPEVYVDYKGRRIGFCCAGCDDAFLKDPAKYLLKLDAAKGGK